MLEIMGSVIVDSGIIFTIIVFVMALVFIILGSLTSRRGRKFIQRRKLARRTRKEVWKMIEKKSTKFDWVVLKGLFCLLLIVIFLISSFLSYFVYLDYGKEACLGEVECDRKEVSYSFEGNHFIFPFKNNLSVTCYCHLGEEIGKNDVLIIPKVKETSKEGIGVNSLRVHVDTRRAE